MKKFLFLSFVLTALVAASPVLAKENGSSFWAGVSKLVHEAFEPEEILEEEVMDEDFVDPMEVQQVLKEIKDQKRELTKIAKRVRKLAGAESVLGEINSLLEQVAGFENSINEGVNLRDAIQEFRDAQIWEELNKIRAKVEIPRELAQWNKEVKRLEKMLKQKKFQNTGFNLTAVGSKIDEIKATLSMVQEFYNSGDFESAMEEFDGLRQDFHPGEIMSVVQRMQEIMSRLRSVKNTELKNQITESLGGVISNFNEGEFRTARELLDESFGEIMKLINQALSVGKKRGASREGFNQMADKLQDQMRDKAEIKRGDGGRIFQQSVRPAGQMKPQLQPRTESEFRPQPQIQPEIQSQSRPIPTETVRPAEPAPRPVESVPAPSIETQPAIEPTR